MSAGPVVDVLVSAFILVGAFFTLVGAVGLVRLPDVYARTHGPTKATTLGVGATLVASAIWSTATSAAPSLHELLVTAFLFSTAPVSAHLMVKAAIHLRLPNVSGARSARGPARGKEPPPGKPG